MMLLIRLSIQEVFRRFCKDDSDGKLVLIFGQGFGNFWILIVATEPLAARSRCALPSFSLDAFSIAEDESNRDGRVVVKLGFEERGRS
jgi:hypothetical protein